MALVKFNENNRDVLSPGFNSISVEGSSEQTEDNKKYNLTDWLNHPLKLPYSHPHS